jgi:CubicO group peptidase (beta-lactamase class C family)
MLTPLTPEAIGLSSGRLERVYIFLEEAVAQGKLPGGALLVARHGSPLPPRSFGRQYPSADSPPMQPDSIFLTASVTKPVTVTAAMWLVERGQLLLDEAVCSLIPEFVGEGKEQVTVRHLMTHTSGLPDMLPEDRRLRTQHAPLSEFIQRIYRTPLLFPPGTDIQYQSCGTAMLAAIVERLTGMVLPAFLRREFFEPLGMQDTALGVQTLPQERIAHVNIPDEMVGKDWGWNTPYWWRFAAPWGGMFSTVGDMFRFCQMFLNGGQWAGRPILSRATVQAMTGDQTSPMAMIPATLRAQQAWGLGWRRAPAAEWATLGDLLSPGSYGHGGATGTMVWVDPPRELVCILFTTQPMASNGGLLGRCSNLVAAAAL